jgi:Domain of unknown function (DUF4915)
MAGSVVHYADELPMNRPDMSESNSHARIDLDAKPTAGERRTLVASGLGTDTGGGVFALDNGQFSIIDRASTTGLAVSPDRSLLARLAWSDHPQIDTPGELRIYDRIGLRTYHRVDDLHEPHSAHWDGDAIVTVSTRTNALLWLNRAGTVVRRWKAPGIGDSWHLNSLTTHQGRILVSAFGCFNDDRAWLDPAVREGQGVVLDVASRQSVLNGLSAPHNPVWLDGIWMICNSARGEVLCMDENGCVRNRRVFDGWTRGLAYDESFVYVGVSAHRLRGEDAGTAFVVALTRDTLDETARWVLPSREVYDVVLMPDALVEGLRAATRGRSDTCRRIGP